MVVLPLKGWSCVTCIFNYLFRHRYWEKAFSNPFRLKILNHEYVEAIQPPLWVSLGKHKTH